MSATKEQVKHTPGQWHFCAYSQITEPIEMGFAILDAIGGEIAVIRRKRTVEPFHEANARLIAAAPETAAERDRLKEVNAQLLEAGTGIIPTIEGIIRAKGIDWVGGATAQKKLDALKAAISKAEGRA